MGRESPESDSHLYRSDRRERHRVDHSALGSDFPAAVAVTALVDLRTAPLVVMGLNCRAQAFRNASGLSKVAVNAGAPVVPAAAERRIPVRSDIAMTIHPSPAFLPDRGPRKALKGWKDNFHSVSAPCPTADCRYCTSRPGSNFLPDMVLPVENAANRSDDTPTLVRRRASSTLAAARDSHRKKHQRTRGPSGNTPHQRRTSCERVLKSCEPFSSS